ncbi:MAG: Jag N-terminal domain-containing protein [Helicobacter sp.]|nr:Jag N-terminal domain-containing protein [Helicobacter sp.]
MKKIEAPTLENALIEASKFFECSIVDLEYEIIQNPSKGFLGVGKKSAIICAELKKSKATPVATQAPQTPVQIPTQTPTTQTSPQRAFDNTFNNSNHFDYSSTPKIPTPSTFTSSPHQDKSIDQIALLVRDELQELFDFLPYKLDLIFVQPYDENTLYIKIDGEDSALLIGKEGYRYKAISYLIFNWINQVYGLMIRLEIAEFLKNQEEMIANYLIPTIETIKLNGKAQTKPLDGVLAHIALKQLREHFPDKYVSFRLNSDGERYIIINDFHHI